MREFVGLRLRLRFSEQTLPITKGFVMKAILLAGGKGARLQPFTATFPKPLVPLDDTPVMEILIRQLAHHGVRDLTIVTGHLAWLIGAYFGHGERFGVRIQYVEESTPLDTAGCLGLIEQPAEQFLVMNGDLLTTLDFARFMAFHRTHQPAVTIAAYKREVKIDLGVLTIEEEGRLTDYIEKPTHDFYVSMGMYCFDPRVCDYVERGERISMPNLILRLRDAGEMVMCYREQCFWLDIGRPDDYARAIEEFRNNRSTFLPWRNAA
jgi:NDP-sugar pyrophosphorylase family protein